MIRMKCPKCGEEFPTVAGLLTVVLSTRMNMVPTDLGVKLGIQSPIRIKTVTTNQPKATCEGCGATVSDWKLVVLCDECGQKITTVCKKCSDKTPSKKIVFNHLCWPSHAIRCPECWARHDAPYCEECSNKATCRAYQHMKGD